MAYTMSPGHYTPPPSPASGSSTATADVAVAPAPSDARGCNLPAPPLFRVRGSGLRVQGLGLRGKG